MSGIGEREEDVLKADLILKKNLFGLKKGLGCEMVTFLNDHPNVS